MTAFLFGFAWGLFAYLTLWWLHGLFEDRKPRRGGEPS